MHASFLKPAGTVLGEGHHGIGWGIPNLGNIFKATFRKAELVPFGALDQGDRLAVPFEVMAVGYAGTWNVTVWFATLPPDGSDDIWAPGATLMAEEAKFRAPLVEGADFPAGSLWVEASDGTGWPEARTRGGEGWPTDDAEALALLEPAAAAVWEALVPYLAG